MKMLTTLFLIFLASNAFAETFTSRVYSIDLPEGKNPALIYFDNGRVVFSKKAPELPHLRRGLVQGEMVKVTVDKNNNFVSATLAPTEESMVSEEIPLDERLSINPSTVSSAEATNIFKRMRRDYQNESQCYNRAHVWAYEEFRKTGVETTKHFLFFTRRYIRNYRYKWWFHVSPSVLVTGLGDRILDRRYTSGHRSVASWLKNFIYSGRACPVVSKYSDYRNHQESQDCYLIPVSQYYWQPRDIDRKERTGHEKTSFIKSEIDHAYWEAF